MNDEKDVSCILYLLKFNIDEALFARVQSRGEARLRMSRPEGNAVSDGNLP